MVKTTTQRFTPLEGQRMYTAESIKWAWPLKAATLNPDTFSGLLRIKKPDC